MDELLVAVRKHTKRPWMFWNTYYMAAFSPPDPSFDFARFEIDDPTSLPSSTERLAKYLGQVRLFKHRDMDAVLIWETVVDGQPVSKEANDFLVRDFHDQILAPACAELGVTVTMGPAVWKKKVSC
jgi:hypothetical protein